MSRLYVARNTRVAARNLDGEMMIMSGKDSTLFTLNKTATIIWQSADGATPLDEIVERRICREYEVDPAAALQDAETLAHELAAHGILDVSENPIIPANSQPANSQLANPPAGESR
jgi:Coenzyme PQQ synthesis protein D (PqqD)